MIWRLQSSAFNLAASILLTGIYSIAAVYVTNTNITRDLSRIEQLNSNVTCYGGFFELSCPNNSKIAVVAIYLGMKPLYDNCTNSAIPSTDCCYKGEDDCLAEETAYSAHMDALTRECSGRGRCEHAHHAEWGDMPTGECGFNLTRSRKYQSNYVFANYTCLEGAHDVDMCRVNSKTGAHMYLSNTKYPSSFMTGFYKCSCSITPTSHSDDVKVNALDIHMSKAVEQSLILSDDNGTSVNVAGSWNGFQTVFTTTNRTVHLSFINYNYEGKGEGHIWLEIKGNAKLSCNMMQKLPLPSLLPIKGHDNQAYVIFKNTTWRMDSNGTCASNMGCMQFNNKRWIFVTNGPCFNDGVQRCLKLVNGRWSLVAVLPSSTVTFAISTTNPTSGPATRLSPKQELVFSYLQMVGASVGTLLVCLLAFAAIIYCQRRVCQTKVKRHPVSMELARTLSKGDNSDGKADDHHLFTVKQQSEDFVLY